MRTKETYLYQFDKLSDKAKDKAREWTKQVLYSHLKKGENYDAQPIGLNR